MSRITLDSTMRELVNSDIAFTILSLSVPVATPYTYIRNEAYNLPDNIHEDVFNDYVLNKTIREFEWDYGCTIFWEANCDKQSNIATQLHQCSCSIIDLMAAGCRCGGS